MVLKPSHCTISHDASGSHLPRVTLSHNFSTPHDQALFANVLSMYAGEPIAYMDTVVLAPLFAELRQDKALPGQDEQRVQYQQMFADLLEAYPYLVSSDRTERYMFNIPGTTCVAALSFLSANGCGRIVFCDDIASLRSGLHTNFVRGALNIGYDGRIEFWMHPWRTLDTVFGPDAGVTLSYWLLRQVHGQLVKDYLNIERYYLDPVNASAGDPATFDAPDETLLYVAWAKAQGCADARAAGANTEENEAAGADIFLSQGALPQLRRRFFFKLLECCSVQIEQGKGSEIKLKSPLMSNIPNVSRFGRLVTRTLK